MSIVKTTLNTRENIKTEIYQQPKLIWPKACLEKKNFEKWKPSQRSAHICACYLVLSQQFIQAMGNLIQRKKYLRNGHLRNLLHTFVLVRIITT